MANDRELAYRLRVYVPVQFTADAEDELADFGLDAYTFYPATGVWHTAKERVRVFEVISEYRHTLEAACSALAMRLLLQGEQAVASTLEEVQFNVTYKEQS